MRVFDLPQAKYFCAIPMVAGAAEQSLAAFHATVKNVSHLQEGTPHFNVHRINLLMSAERWLLYSVGNYRRALEMLVPASAPWAQVTLYYASFFSANALLAMFGGWIGNTAAGPRMVDVENGAVGNQTLRIFRGASVKAPSGSTGSHRVFWDFFYAACPTILPWAPAHLTAALQPVNGDYAWQISARNNVNYDMFHAWGASSQFYQTFKNPKLKTLGGSLRLQQDAAEQLIRLALHFATALSLSGVALNGCGMAGDRASIHRRLVKQQAPALLNQSAFADLAQ